MCRLETEIERERWSRMTQREKDDELHRARVHISLFVVCTSCSTRNTAKVSCRDEKIASKKFKR